MNIIIPDPTLVLLVGPSGAGKSTFAQAHFRPTEIVSSDAMRAMLSNDPADQGASGEAFRVLSTIVNGRLKRRLLTVVDATNLAAGNRSRYRRLAARYGISSVVIAFDFPEPVYRERNASRPDRVVDDGVVSDHAARMAAALVDIAAEGFQSVVVLDENATLGDIVIERVEHSPRTA